MSSQFVYITYIRGARQDLWRALTDPEVNAQFWFGYRQQSSWKSGSSWTLRAPDGAVNATGEVLECEPGRRLGLRWFSECTPERKADGETRCSFALETVGDCTELTVTHSCARAESAMVRAASASWPKILASLKSLIETGSALDIHHPQKGSSND